MSHSREAEPGNNIKPIKELITVRIETAQAVGSTEVLNEAAGRGASPEVAKGVGWC